MTSVDQNRANLENSKLSTGPRTPEGKATSSRNAIKHGLLAKTLLTPKDQDEYGSLAEEMYDDMQPVGQMECELVKHVISGWIRLMRATELESGFMLELEVKANTTAGHNNKVAQLKTLEAYHRWCAFKQLFEDGDRFEKLGRYRRDILREVERAFAELRLRQHERLARASAGDDQ